MVRSLMVDHKAVAARAGSMLGAVSSLVLHGPQRTQVGLLRLGQTPDAFNIQSLVGSIPPQRAQMLATVQVPDGDGPPGI
jgi:hypothetical protein